MKAFNYFKSLAMTALILALGGGLAGCIENDDEQLGDMPVMKLSATTLNFTQEPDEPQSFRVEITGAGSWEVSAGDAYADQVTITPSSGNKSADVQVMPTATMTPRQISLEVTLYGEIVGRHVMIEKQTVVVNQSADGGAISSEALYFDNFDGQVATQTFGSGTSWPYLDQFLEFANPTGAAAANVTYSGTGISIRANSASNSNYSDVPNASGDNNIFFGANASFVVNGLKLAADQSNLRLQFASEKYSQTLGSVFLTSEFHIWLSKDGENWAEVKNYVFHGGTNEGRWNLAEAFFSLKAVPETLYMKFTADAASAYRMDDLALYVNLTGTTGQEIDLENIEAGGDQPEQPGGDDSNLKGFESQAAFTVTADDSDSSIYTLGSSTVNGKAATGAKFGTGSKTGTYTTPALGVTGDKYLSFYGFAWKGTTASVHIKINGGGTIDGKTETAVELKGNDGASNNAPFTITATDADYYSMKVTGLTAASTVTLSTTAETGYRVILARVRLTDTNEGPESGAGETPEQPEQPGDGDAVTMTIPEIIAACVKSGSEQSVLNATNDVVFEAAVVTDKAGGNWSSNNLAVMTPGATTSKNGILLYGSGITNPGDASYDFEPGDKVKVTLKAGQARVTVYSTCNEVTGSQGAAWITIEKTGDKVDIKPVELTSVDNLVDYQSMPVTVKNVTSPASGTWKDTQTFKAGNVNLTVYTASGATFYDKAYKGNVTGDLTGMVTLYKGAVQLAPRNETDIKAFMDGGNTEPEQPEEPTVGMTPENPLTVAQAIAIANEAGETATAAEYYVKGIITSIKYTFSAQYGTATFDIIDEGAADAKFTAYSVKYLNNQKWVEGNEQVTVGDEVIVCGKLMTYNGTPETSSGSGYIYQFVSKAEPEQPEQPVPDDGSFLSDDLFVCTASTTSNPASYDATTFNGQKATGFKLGTSSKAGAYTTEAVGVTGNYTLTFYAVAWKNMTGTTVKVSVADGGEVSSADTFTIAANDGATGNAPFTITVSDSDKYTVELTGLTANSKITIETTEASKGRAVVAGVKLAQNGSGTVTPEPDPTPGDKYTVVDKPEDLKEGKYYMAGYSEAYTSTTFSPYSYHVWTGTIASGDCVTCGHEFDKDNGTLTKNPSATTEPAWVELVAVSGKENTYYIVCDGKYLSTSDYTANRKLQLGDIKGEWTMSEHSKGGIQLTTSDNDNSIILGTAGAASNLLRSYKAPANSLTYGVCFIKK